MNRTSRRPDVCCTIDVLSDGSEFTGQGTLFLSIWKKPRNGTFTTSNGTPSWLEEAMELQPPLGRYAICGIGDGTSRLAADQRFKLSPTRAVFASTCEALDGLPALLLALSSAGIPSLHIASTKADMMEELATTILGCRRSFNITNCLIPDGDGWWQVFHDAYLTVHASRRDNSNNRDKVTFLFTIHTANDAYTVALLPPHCHSIQLSYDDLIRNDLPVVNINNMNSNQDQVVQVIALIALDPQDTHWKTVDIPGCLVMVTKPQVSASDPGILGRSQRVIEYLSNELPQSFIPLLPKLQHDTVTNICSHADEDTTTLKPFQLLSGTSIILHDEKSFDVIRRGTSQDNRHPIEDDWTSTIDSMRAFQEPNQAPVPASTILVDDENEIDLDDDEDSDGNDDHQEDKKQKASPGTEQSRSAMLVVLGTGCAKPSAVRGASAHALIFRSTQQEGDEDGEESDVFLLDCGEGVTTMLSRYGPKDWQHQIRGIWISHSHLDHFGGLVTVLRTLNTYRRECRNRSDPSRMVDTKRRKIMQRNCWVMAPPKILRYLDLSLNCRHGKDMSTGNAMFEPYLHHDPTIPPGPWNYFQSIKVPHNCYPSYALLLGWPMQGSPPYDHNQTSWFCFSGDTRPANSLIHSCRKVRRSGDTLFLLHEATFEDSEQEQAELKMHSTVSEAISVAKDVQATRLLLTHFSQRYVAIQSHLVAMSDGKFRVGLAMDGLRVILD